MRVYQGSPALNREPESYASDRRHRAAWEKKGVTVISRPLRYSRDQPPREKGIDVALAIDFVGMAVDGDYDIGVLASTDTDLVPALEYVIKRGIRVETAAWLASVDRSLKVPGAAIWNHRLRKEEYDRVTDNTDYRPPK